MGQEDLHLTSVAPEEHRQETILRKESVHVLVDAAFVRQEQQGIDSTSEMNQWLLSSKGSVAPVRC